MKVYITASFRGADNKMAIEKLCDIVHKSGFEDFCFIRDVEKYQKIFKSPLELMQRAKDELEFCDALLMEYDGPATGRMIELGMAYALNKKIILILKEGFPLKDTVAGVADHILYYHSLEDLVDPLSKIYLEWENKSN